MRITKWRKEVAFRFGRSWKEIYLIYTALNAGTTNHQHRLYKR